MMKNVNDLFYLRAKDKRTLQDDYIKAIKDHEFKLFLNNIMTTEDVLIKYTSRLKQSFDEHKKCNGCKCLETCKNAKVGYRLTPYANSKSISFSVDACPYEQERIKNSSYQKNITMFDTPKGLREATFRNIYIDDKNRVEIIKYLKEFMDNYPDKFMKGLYLYGAFGTGKTYLIAALLNEYGKRGTKSVIIYYPEFLRSLKESFGADYKEKFSLVMHAPLLLVDDIGAENLTPWSRDEILGPILQYRMDEKLPTFFTSNLSLEDLEVHLALSTNGVEKIKARRIVERIKELSTGVKLTSKNRRD